MTKNPRIKIVGAKIKPLRTGWDMSHLACPRDPSLPFIYSFINHLFIEHLSWTRPDAAEYSKMNTIPGPQGAHNFWNHPQVRAELSHPWSQEKKLVMGVRGAVSKKRVFQGGNFIWGGVGFHRDLPCLPPSRPARFTSSGSPGPSPS